MLVAHFENLRGDAPRDGGYRTGSGSDRDNGSTIPNGI
jgi:hypothetical protein